MLTILWLILVLLTSVSSPAMAFECGIFPGEGPHKLEAPGGDIVLRGAPSQVARVVETIRPGKGASIKWSYARFRTVSPGIFLARESGTIKGKNYGRVFYLSKKDYYRGYGRSESFHYAAGDSIEYLQYRAEGSAFIRINGVVVGADLLSKLAVPLKEVKRPQLELWIEVTGEDGHPIGWYQLTDDQIHQPKAGSMGPGPEFLP